MTEHKNFVEIPFQYRYQCWFCAEPAADAFTFPDQHHIVLDCQHPKLTIPSCVECTDMAKQAAVDSIWQVQRQVKKALMKKYQKDLAIGLNWTEEALANAGFEGGNFAGFQKSAWFMYQVAKARLNFMGWPLVVDGIDVVTEEGRNDFQFDGVCYPSLEHAIDHFSRTFSLDSGLLKQILAKLGKENFAQAVRICRLYVGATPDEKLQALRTLSS
ncbi:hypothetical protein SAMN05216262_11328 [Colwellia chukchiensis]|uniref:Uncharacterized protein n=1 Tax=Colwellia chukchiensis TaxID=641665 RepID=A0A1H7QZN5_9GAMM|nr:hypothetical protein [Colwellia chukchiensis]SEL53491.1 hypothetical protein SAMN05216262_11328 [Colwellia chukchiensis]